MNESEITVGTSADGEVFLQIAVPSLVAMTHLTAECARSLAAKLIEAADESEELEDQ